MKMRFMIAIFLSESGKGQQKEIYSLYMSFEEELIIKFSGSENRLLEQRSGNVCNSYCLRFDELFCCKIMTPI